MQRLIALSTVLLALYALMVDAYPKILGKVRLNNHVRPSQLYMTSLGDDWKPFKAIAASLLALTVSGSSSNAGIFQSSEQDRIDAISRYQKPVAELLDQLRPVSTPNAVGVYSNNQVLKGGKEDSTVVLNYLENYIKPCQEQMQAAAPLLKLPDSNQAKVETYPLALKGHILELRQAINEQKAESQAREVEEVQATLADFLKIASLKYTVDPYVPSRPLSDAELFGPLGCEFWGKERVPGSNACKENVDMPR